MPEGPEVETVRRTLEPLLVGETIDSVWLSTHSLRISAKLADFAPVLQQKIVSLHRHGKLLWILCANKSGMMIRLGMTGQAIVTEKSTAVAKHTHVKFDCKGKEKQFRYIDPRRFGSVNPFTDEKALQQELAKIGPDPIVWNDKQKLIFIENIRKTQREIKVALLDQQIIASVGNIYASEALFLAQISPFAVSNHLDDKALMALADAVEGVLRRAVANRGTSFSDYVDGTGQRGENQLHLSVFQREGEACRRCTGTIERAVQGGRSTFYCVSCQTIG